MKTAHHELLKRHHCNLELFAVQRVRDEATLLFGRRCAIKCVATPGGLSRLAPTHLLRKSSRWKTAGTQPQRRQHPSSPAPILRPSPTSITF